MSEAIIQIILFLFAFLLIISGIVLLFKGKGWSSFTPMAFGVLLVIMAGVAPSSLKEITAKWGYGGGEIKFNREINEKSYISPEVFQFQPSQELVLAASKKKDSERTAEDYLHLASEAFNKQQMEKGLMLAYSGLKLDPKKPKIKGELYSTIGLIYLLSSSPNLAESNFKKAVEADSKTSGFLINLGNLYVTSGEYIKAENAINRAIELDPKDPQAYLALGTVYYVWGKYSAAEMNYKKGIELNRGSIEGQLNLGILYVDMKKYSEAEEAFKRVLKNNSNDLIVNYELGRNYLSQRKFNEAEKYFKISVDLMPEYYLGHHALGVAYASQEKYSEAEEAFKRALEINPDLKATQRNLEQLRKIRKENKK